MKPDTLLLLKSLCIFVVLLVEKVGTCVLLMWIHLCVCVSV